MPKRMSKSSHGVKQTKAKALSSRKQDTRAKAKQVAAADNAFHMTFDIETCMFITLLRIYNPGLIAAGRGSSEGGGRPQRAG